MGKTKTVFRSRDMRGNARRRKTKREEVLRTASTSKIEYVGVKKDNNRNERGPSPRRLWRKKPRETLALDKRGNLSKNTSLPNVEDPEGTKGGLQSGNRDERKIRPFPFGKGKKRKSKQS